MALLNNELAPNFKKCNSNSHNVAKDSIKRTVRDQTGQNKRRLFVTFITLD